MFATVGRVGVDAVDDAERVVQGEIDGARADEGGEFGNRLADSRVVALTRQPFERFVKERSSDLQRVAAFADRHDAPATCRSEPDHRPFPTLQIRAGRPAPDDRQRRLAPPDGPPAPTTLNLNGDTGTGAGRHHLGAELEGHPHPHRQQP